MTGASRQRLASDVAIQVVARVFNLALGIVVTVILSRSLGEVGFGQWATLLAVVQVAGYLGEFGVLPAAVNRAAAEPGAAPRWLAAMLATRTVLAVPAALGAFAVAATVSDGDTMLVAAAVLAITVLLGAPASLSAVFQLRVRNDLTMATITANSLLWTGAAAVLLATGNDGLVPFAVALVVAQALTTFAQAGYALRLQPLRFDGVRDSARELARVGVPVGIGSLLTLAYGRIDQVLVFQVAGAGEAGLYGAAYQLLERAQVIPGAVMTTLFPLVAAARAVDPERVRRLVQRTGEYLAAVSLPAFGFVLIAAEPIVVLLFGEDFREAAAALRVLMAAFVLTAFGFLVGQLAVVYDLQVRFIAFALVALVVNVAANLLLLPTYGHIAAAWVTLGTEALVLTLASRSVLGAMGLRPSAGRLLRIAAAAAVMTVAVWAADRAGAPLVALGVVAGVVFAPVVVVLGGVPADELRSLARRDP